MAFLQPVSIFCEVVVMLVGLLLFVKKKKVYGLGIFFTFAIYVFYDAVNYFPFIVSTSFTSPLFFLATIAILLSVIAIYKEK